MTLDEYNAIAITLRNLKPVAPPWNSKGHNGALRQWERTVEAFTTDLRQTGSVFDPTLFCYQTGYRKERV